VTAEEWLSTRSPRPPDALLRRVRALVAPAGSASPPHAPDVYLAAAEQLLARLLREGCAARDSALDLLAADALVTYAFEAAAEAPGEIPRRAEAAMGRIAGIADAATGRPAEHAS
jgi:hypothetical protein